jgi:hypothetical protein
MEAKRISLFREIKHPFFVSQNSDHYQTKEKQRNDPK